MLIEVEKIASVLETVRDICDAVADCPNCPFFIEDKDEGYEDCEVYYPHRWDKNQDPYEWEDEE